MKKLLLFLFIIPLYSVACNMNTSKESKAKNLIKEYFRTHIKNENNYEVEEFSKLDSTYDVRVSDKYIALNKKHEYYLKALDRLLYLSEHSYTTDIIVVYTTN